MKKIPLNDETVQPEDQEVVWLKQKAKQATEKGDYAKAEELLNQAEGIDLKAIEQLEEMNQASNAHAQILFNFCESHKNEPGLLKLIGKLIANGSLANELISHKH